MRLDRSESNVGSGAEQAEVGLEALHHARHAVVRQRVQRSGLSAHAALCHDERRALGVGTERAAALDAPVLAQLQRRLRVVWLDKRRGELGVGGKVGGGAQDEHVADEAALDVADAIVLQQRRNGPQAGGAVAEALERTLAGRRFGLAGGLLDRMRTVEGVVRRQRPAEGCVLRDFGEVEADILRTSEPGLYSQQTFRKK
jgi:hypothetical protein